MISSISAIRSARSASAADLRAAPTDAAQIREAGRALERAKRELAGAQLQADQQAQRAADAKREIERLRWLNAGVEVSPVTVPIAPSAINTQAAAIDAASIARDEAAAQILRLQNRVERQTTRYFELQIRVRKAEDSYEPYSNETKETRPEIAPENRKTQGSKSKESPSDPLAPAERDQTKRGAPQETRPLSRRA